MRPGPEFILRKYEFKRRRFTLHQYYYKDPECRHPKYGVLAHGTWKLKRPSWIVLGGMEADYRIKNVSVIPYSEESAANLQKLSLTCTDLKRNVWRPYKSSQIMNFPIYRKRKRKQFNFERDLERDFDCTSMLNLTFHELQLVRKEITRLTRVVRKKTKTSLKKYVKKYKKKRELLLGDIHTVTAKRKSYRPTNYQVGLYSAKVCIQS